ncbi:protein of unknown function [Bradyrhizobium vignae]|uniref:Uncharacterized protein n=1 Tax=Bradyrhizobium vignae TaxID=1549949 RepID=A0A2U3PVD6_9BRAD|nr:protein of unknown function [Bradyrhizobium vignae]
MVGLRLNSSAHGTNPRQTGALADRMIRAKLNRIMPWKMATEIQFSLGSGAVNIVTRWPRRRAAQDDTLNVA